MEPNIISKTILPKKKKKKKINSYNKLDEVIFFVSPCVMQDKRVNSNPIIFNFGELGP